MYVFIIIFIDVKKKLRIFQLIVGIRVEKHTSNVQTFNRSMHPRVQSVLASRHCGSSRAKVRLHEKGKAVYFSKHPSIRGLDTGPEGMSYEPKRNAMNLSREKEG